jgi:hypothetical protein
VARTSAPGSSAGLRRGSARCAPWPRIWPSPTDRAWMGAWITRCWWPTRFASSGWPIAAWIVCAGGCRTRPQATGAGMVICVDEFGPLNLQPDPGREWARRAGGGERLARRRASYTRPHGVRHMFGAGSAPRSPLRAQQAAQGPHPVPAFCRCCARSTCPGQDALVPDNSSPHLSTRTDPRVADWVGTTMWSWLRALLRPLAELHRARVHRPALLRPGRHPPPHPPRLGEHDPPLHRLAEPSRLGRAAPRGRQAGKLELTRSR